MTAADVVAPLAGVGAAVITDELVPAIDGNPQLIENRLRAPLRALAVARLAATPARVAQLGQLYVQELNRRVAVALHQPADADAANS